jgi:phage terminase large subunit-like protein
MNKTISAELLVLDHHGWAQSVISCEREARAPKRRGRQIPPADLDWEILLFRAGRGYGKTKAVTEWLWWEMWRQPNLVDHIVALTISDVIGTSFEGPGGLLATVPPECLRGGSQDRTYVAHKRQLRLANGSLVRGFGAQEEGGRLRGPRCHCLGGDELREWDRPIGNLEQALNNALFGLRLPLPDGTPARAVLGASPKVPQAVREAARRPRRHWHQTPTH